MIGREHYFLNNLEDESDSEILSNFIKQYYMGRPLLPNKIMIKEEIEDMEEIVKDGYLSEDRKEEDITELAERLKELENQIVKIVEKS